MANRALASEQPGRILCGSAEGCHYLRRGETPMMRLNAVAKCCGDENP